MNLGLVELFGRGYVIEHCISSFKRINEKKSYKVYVTDALMAIADNTTHILSMEGIVDYGRTMNKRWIDIVNTPPKSEEPEDNRSSEEIAADMWQRIRGH